MMTDWRETAGLVERVNTLEVAAQTLSEVCKANAEGGIHLANAGITAAQEARTLILAMQSLNELVTRLDKRLGVVEAQHKELMLHATTSHTEAA
jgi:hypothetical protein